MLVVPADFEESAVDVREVSVPFDTGTKGSERSAVDSVCSSLAAMASAKEASPEDVGKTPPDTTCECGAVPRG